ncbi:MAG: GtrA family protein [Candidatus Nanoarchaeia archaeon]
MRYKQGFQCLTKFMIAGISFACLGIILLYIFTDIIGIFYLLSAILTFIICSTGNFLINKKYTFQESIREGIARKYIGFIAINTSALFVNLFFLALLTEVIGIYYLLSYIVAMCCAFFINFFGVKTLIFK